MFIVVKIKVAFWQYEQNIGRFKQYRVPDMKISNFINGTYASGAVLSRDIFKKSYLDKIMIVYGKFIETQTKQRNFDFNPTKYKK